MTKKSGRCKKYARVLLAVILIVLTSFTSIPFDVLAVKQGISGQLKSAECFAEWNMDEGQGTAIYDEYGNYDGTLKGKVDWADGIKGKALSFEGGYVELGIPDLKGEWTMALWVKKGMNTHTNSVLIGGKSAELKLEQYNKTKKLGITVVGKKDYTFDYVLPEGEWYHLAFVSDSSGTSLYVNGEHAGSIPVAIDGPAYRLGAAESSDETSKGNMRAVLDEVKIYKEALTAEQIKDIFEGNVTDYTKEDLFGLLEQTQNYVKEDYTEKSWNTFAEAVAKANEVIADDNAAQADINRAYKQLKSSIEKLIETVGENEIHIGTFNIAANRKPDIETMRTVMEEKQIEIAGIQEVDMFTGRNNYDMLQKFVDGGYYSNAYFQKSIDYSGGEYGNGTLSIYPFSDTGGALLPATEGIEGRSYSRVILEKNGRQIAFYNTHLSYENYESRSEQIQTILAVMDKDPTPYKILTGDFNTNVSRSEFYPFLRNYNIANGKDNVWYDTVKKEDSGSTKSLCIDNIITTRNIKVNKVDMYESELSDHNLFYAECEFLDEEQPSFQLLDIRVDEASDYDEEKYTPASYEKLQKAMEDAKQLSSQASQAEINAAVDALESAMEGLERIPGEQTAQPSPEELREEYEYYDVLSDEFNGSVSDMWLMDYMPWWSDTAKREQSGTKTRYRFIDADSADNKSLQIYVNGNNVMGSENFQPYYLEKLSGPSSLEPRERYLADTSQKNSLNSKFAGFMAGSKDYLNTYRGQNAPIENHSTYKDSGATTYGYFETRVKFMSIKRGQGIAPAFWFIGMQDEADELGEVDVFEIIDNHTLDFTIHPKGDPDIKKVTKRITFDEDLSKEYHTYGVLWDETGFSLYVDGEFIYKHDQKIDYRMIPIFSINHHENGWIGSVDNQNLPEERTMDIDYYRVFKKSGTDPEQDKADLPDMEEGNNVSKAAYISLFGLTGVEADETPMQWLNDMDTKNTVLSGKNDAVGNPIKTSVLPQYLNIEWKTPAVFNTIILHAQNALSTAPTLIDVEVSEDGTKWNPILEDVRLEWKTDSQVAESQKIVLPKTQKDNLHTRIVIKEANMKNGQFGLCEVEIGENIEAMEPEYLPLPDTILDTEAIKSSEFTTWKMEDSLTSENGMKISMEEGTASYTDSVEGNGKALKIDGNTQVVKAPLKNSEGQQLKGDEDFTLSMWINPTYVSKKTGNSKDQIILAQQTGTSGGRPWMFLYEGTLGTYIGNVNTFGKIKVQKDTWQHVAVTFKVTDKEKKQAEVCLYVNGKADTSATVTYETDSLANPELLLGRHKNMKKGQYQGAMDEITLLKRALTEEEMAALYEADGKVDHISNKIYDATSVTKLPVISGKAGELQQTDLDFAEKISVVFEDLYTEDLPVIWNQEEIDKIDLNKPGTYTIHGILDMSGYQNISNTKNLFAEQQVEIKEQVSLAQLAAVLDRVNAVKQEEYTETSFDKFIAACESVQTQETLLIIGKYPEFSVPETVPEYATQDLVDKMVSDIEKAFDLLVKKDGQSKISTAVLEYALELAKKADTEGVLASVVDKFNAAVESGQALLDRVQAGDTAITQEMADNAWQEIINMMQYLSFKQGDKTDLAKVIALADEMNAHISSYLEEGKDAFVKALADAKEVQADGNAMQEEVNEAWKDLLTAMAGLQKIPDKTALEELLNKAKGLNEADYETASFGAFARALADAKAVYEDEQATTAEVNAAAKELEGAIAKLAPAKQTKENTVVNAGNQAGSDDKAVSADKKDADTTNRTAEKSVKTGDVANTAAVAAVMFAAAMTVVMVYTKKKEGR